VHRYLSFSFTVCLKGGGIVGDRYFRFVDEKGQRVSDDVLESIVDKKKSPERPLSATAAIEDACFQGATSSSDENEKSSTTEGNTSAAGTNDAGTAETKDQKALPQFFIQTRDTSAMGLYLATYHSLAAAEKATKISGSLVQKGT